MNIGVFSNLKFNLQNKLDSKNIFGANDDIYKKNVYKYCVSYCISVDMKLEKSCQLRFECDANFFILENRGIVSLVY